MARGRPSFALAITCLALLAAAGTTLLAACGGPTRYRNDTYRFSLKVDRPLVEWRSSGTAEGRGFQVAFVDPDGAKAGDRHLDALTVTAVTSPTSVTIDQLDKLRAALGELAVKMVQSLGTDTSTGSSSAVSVGGLPGIVVPYATTIGGQRVVGWQYLLVGGGHTYGLNAGAAGADWNRLRPVFEKAVQSFATF